METLPLWFAVVMAVWASPLFAQDWAGAWQGTLQIFKEEQMLIEISKVDDGAWKFVLRNVTYGGRPNVASPVSIQGPNEVALLVADEGSLHERELHAERPDCMGLPAQFAPTDRRPGVARLRE